MVELYLLGAAGAAVALPVLNSAVKVIWRKIIRPKLKGRQGEAKVGKLLKKAAGKGSHGKNDILIPSDRGTTQIDHLMVTRHGIFVVETKNYSGIVQGTENAKMWRQFFPDGRSASREFLNPILQNKGHIQALKKILGEEYSNVPMHSLVVFSGNCRYPDLPGVFNARQLKPAVKFLSSGAPVLSKAQVDEISKIIDNREIKSRRAYNEHNLRASFAAGGSNPQEIEALINHSIDNSVRINFPPPPEPVSHGPLTKPQRLTDIRATLSIKGQTNTIDGFFEAAKRRDDGQPVTPGGNFDYFICPYTGDKFPPSEAINMYRGLWITYLNAHSDLAAYMKENGTEKLGNSFRCKKTLSLYNEDKDGFSAEVRKSAWYQNMVETRNRSSNGPATEKQRNYVQALANSLNIPESEYPDFADYKATSEWIKAHKDLKPPAKDPKVNANKKMASLDEKIEDASNKGTYQNKPRVNVKDPYPTVSR